MKITAVLLASVFSTLFTPTSSATVAANGMAVPEVTVASTTGLSISQDASSAYVDKCDNPNSNVLITQAAMIQISDAATGTQGFIALDRDKKEVVVAFRGSESLLDAYMDVKFDLVPFVVSNIGGPQGVKVHQGFLQAWNGVAKTVNTVVREYLKDGYTLVITGHSLGGAIASLAGITLNQDLTIRTGGVRIYTYGQPRTGNVKYAEWVNKYIGTANMFRVVNFDDPIPHLPFRTQKLDYLHHGTEYWSFTVSPSAMNTKKCQSVGEDPKCSGPSPYIRPNPTRTPHRSYFGLKNGLPYCTKETT
ncbi:Alpha/Beta hydrolase protein [Collybia nuda]|uniref:Alpha/Beta hydrolase protein n=1 Tax=Collybia nuda TaxID=64659 RepID=A0A9P6CIT9_9AGAR|nr:Alpha/Beta hydrolase protein [Collybia nuda]